MYLRSISEELRATEDIDDYRVQYTGFDEYYADACEELSRNPRLGDLLPFAPDFRLYETKPSGKLPAFHILYTFDENTVYLHSIQPVNANKKATPPSRLS